MKIAITSVLIIKENILFLEEWIDYHLLLGFDKIYLYDNSKVEKKSEFDSNNSFLIPQKINKYGINYDKMCVLTEHEISQLILKIKDKYKDYVLFIDWSPKDENGLICYNQVEAHHDCLHKLKETDIQWCASIDIDEFIILNNGNNTNIKQFLESLDCKITNIMISQFRFDSRFNNLNKLILTINKTEFDDIDRYDSPKYIYNVQHTNKLNVHFNESDVFTINPDRNIIRFNHYKIDFNNTNNNYKIIDSQINNNILEILKSNSIDYFAQKYL